LDWPVWTFPRFVLSCVVNMIYKHESDRHRQRCAHHGLRCGRPWVRGSHASAILHTVALRTVTPGALAKTSTPCRGLLPCPAPSEGRKNAAAQHPAASGVSRTARRRGFYHAQLRLRRRRVAVVVHHPAHRTRTRAGCAAHKAIEGCWRQSAKDFWIVKNV